MPLAAVVEGRRVSALALTEDAWDALVIDLRKRERVALLDGCGHPSFGRISKLGTKHFVHRARASCRYAHKPESAEHMRIQELVFQACTAAGWEAAVEHPIGDRFADVAAWKDGQCVVIEVQLAPEDPTTLRQRTATYANYGARTLWLVPPRSSLRGLSMPIAGVTLDAKKCTVEVPNLVSPLQEFVAGWLRGRTSYVNRMLVATVRRVRLGILSKVCSKCRTTNVYCEYEAESRVDCTCKPRSLTAKSEYVAPTQSERDLADLLAFVTGKVDSAGKEFRVAHAEYLPANPYPLQAYLRCSACAYHLHEAGDIPTVEDQGAWLETASQSYSALPHWCINTVCS